MAWTDLFEADQIVARLECAGSEAKQISQTIPDINFLNQLAFGEFKIRRIIAYYKPDEGVSLDGCTLKVRYTKVAWYHSLTSQGGGDYPIVAYLSWDDGPGWAKTWVPLTVTDYTIPEDSDDNHGYLDIELDDIPDPLIGGC